MTPSDSPSDRPLEGRELFAAGFLSAGDFETEDGEPEIESIGPYPVVRRLGQGAMGSVYLVRDPDTERNFAIKLLSPQARRSSGYARFLREANVLAKIRHRNVVRVHRLEESDAGTYIVQEFVEGRSLRELCADRPLDPREAAALVRDLAEAVGAVHAAGILHRDLKPANVVVQDGIPVLLDFGVARDMDAETLTQSGALVGTPAYMPPEQLKSGSSKADARADVYGLGALLYTLLTGAPPFSGGMVQVLNAVAHHDPRWPSELFPTPASLDAVCRRAMAKTPEDRYPDVAALRVDLERFLRGRRVSALPSRPGLGSAAAIVLVVVAVLTGAAWALGGAGSSPPPPTDSSAPAVDSAAVDSVPAPLWSCAEGEVVAFRTTYLEREGVMTYDLEVFFRSTVRVIPGGLRFETEVEGVRARFEQASGQLSPLGVSFDSRDPPGHEHPLTHMRRAIGTRYTFTVDPQTGAVSEVKGMQAIADAVDELQGPGNPMLQPTVYAGLCQAAFNDAHIQQVYATLLHVRGEGRTLSWEPADALSYVLRGTVYPDPVLRPLAPARRVRPSDRFEVRGRARYAAGRLQFARVEQQLSGEDDHVRWGYHAR